MSKKKTFSLCRYAAPIVACLAIGSTTLASSMMMGGGASYDFDFQRMVGNRAEFFVTGPATGDNFDVQGDAAVTQVVYASGDEFIQFYKPVAVHDIEADGDLRKFLIRAGANCTTGLSDMNHMIANRNHSQPTQAEKDVFADLALQALQSNNLNNYIDTHSNNVLWSMTIEFEKSVKDNDPEPDDFGEILYFERGAGSGNSWMKMQAIDEDGNALGPWLVIGPTETVQTTPMTRVYRADQKMGTTAIDISRLGVSECKFLRISNDVMGDSAYTGGGDINPDFKLMVVITNPVDLQQGVMYD